MFINYTQRIARMQDRLYCVLGDKTSENSVRNRQRHAVAMNSIHGAKHTTSDYGVIVTALNK